MFCFTNAKCIESCRLNDDADGDAAAAADDDRICVCLYEELGNQFYRSSLDKLQNYSIYPKYSAFNPL